MEATPRVLEARHELHTTVYPMATAFGRKDSVGAVSCQRRFAYSTLTSYMELTSVGTWKLTSVVHLRISDIPFGYNFGPVARIMPNILNTGRRIFFNFMLQRDLRTQVSLPFEVVVRSKCTLASTAIDLRSFGRR